MTISGPQVDLSRFKNLELLPISEAQDYVSNLEPELSDMDGVPLFFIHDGQSGTSDDFISEAVNIACSGEDIEGTEFQKLMKLLSDTHHTIRIWYAGNDPTSYKHVQDCFSYKETILRFQKMARTNSMINIRAQL